MSRKPQCPVTCHGGAIRPRRAGAPSCETRHLRSARSVLAKQVDYQTSFLLSSADGSRELSKVRDGIGKLVEPSSPLQPLRPHRSSNRTDWRDPPTTLGGRQLDYCWWTTFSVSLEGVTETEAASIHEFCTTIPFTRAETWPPCACSLQHRKLMAQDDKFQHEVTALAEPHPHRRKPLKDPSRHRL
jgi:hypothetical protein